MIEMETLLHVKAHEARVTELLEHRVFSISVAISCSFIGLCNQHVQRLYSSHLIGAGFRNFPKESIRLSEGKRSLVSQQLYQWRVCDLQDVLRPLLRYRVEGTYYHSQEIWVFYLKCYDLVTNDMTSRGGTLRYIGRGLEGFGVVFL